MDVTEVAIAIATKAAGTSAVPTASAQVASAQVASAQVASDRPPSVLRSSARQCRRRRASMPQPRPLLLSHSPERCARSVARAAVDGAGAGADVAAAVAAVKAHRDRHWARWEVTRLRGRSPLLETGRTRARRHRRSASRTRVRGHARLTRCERLTKHASLWRARLTPSRASQPRFMSPHRLRTSSRLRSLKGMMLRASPMWSGRRRRRRTGTRGAAARRNRPPLRERPKAIFPMDYAARVP
jgi:hypothetical protein